ncbi:ABC transporter ATP-binding protein [Fulvivirgaceae bacterium BMA12]|uniref:ABC transporter ATP-binding protein n=1 Tax=Agaribacillus aureus TaxID=3051825 RepID=A0ABT8L7U3_9BACT|nr:ABC transporter ATP-binding protein [Fulvivirgaceae bacterium BMA12]
MNSNNITQIIREVSQLLGQEHSDFMLTDQYLSTRDYALDQVVEFKRDLIEVGNSAHVIFLENSLPLDEFPAFLDDIALPVVVFLRADNELHPAILYRQRQKILCLRPDLDDPPVDFTQEDFNILLTDSNKEVVFLGAFSYKSLVSDNPEDEEKGTPFTPMKRLFRLLSEEKRDIVNIFIYAIFIGLIGLTLPLGIQATIELVSGGVVVSSVYILISLVIVGVLAAGGLQVMQITIVEYLQRRIFTKAALEFAFRVPRIKVEAIINQYAPELMNRFFDVLTLQKGLPKLLIDLTAASMQILFGLILLSFYHPFFVFFGVLLLGTLTLIFYLTGPKGLRTSIKESKFKYKVVYWLEELARTINSFKISGNTTLPIKRTEYNINNYLKNRKAHFRVLITQYMHVILFKAIITGGLLIIGTVLVIQREITLGQFVASEVIIILILGSVEKIILYMDVVYDLLTAVDKIAHVTDIPLEKSGGINISRGSNGKGFSIDVHNLKYKFPNAGEYALEDINLKISPGEKVCIAGGSGSGKTSLVNTLSGLHYDYEGIITINGVSLRDLDLSNLRDQIGKNVSQEDIFDGTILENILVGKPHSTPQQAIACIKAVGLDETINQLPDGLDTHIVSGGKGYSSSFINRFILARCLAKNPRLLILNDFFVSFTKSDKLELIHLLAGKDHHWTLLAISNDPVIMAACDSVIVMENGTIKARDSYEALLEQKLI